MTDKLFFIIIDMIIINTNGKDTGMDIQMLDEGNASEGSIWDYFQKEPTMTGEEIAEELGQTRQNVSRILKKILARSIAMVRRTDPKKGWFDSAVQVAKIMGVDFSIESEVKKFFTLFPLRIKKLIEDDARSRLEAGKRRLSIL